MPDDAPPARYLHEKKGSGLRLQAFVIPRDPEGRIAVQRIEQFPDAWLLPGEMLQEGEDPADAAERIAGMYFSSPVEGIELADVVSYPPEPPENEKWYLIFLFEGQVPADPDTPEDTLELAFHEPGEPPAPLGFDHATIWEAVTGRRPGIDVS